MNSKLHPLLERQLRKLELESSVLLAQEPLARLLDKVSETYFQLYSHVEMKDNILEVEGREYQIVFDELAEFNKKLSLMVDEKTVQLMARENSIENQKFVALGEISAGIAHEINNPLAIIVGLTSMIKRLLSAPKMDTNLIIEKVDRIYQVSMRITKIIEGIRSFARQSNGDPMRPTSIGKVIDDTLLLCVERMRNLGIEVIYKDKQLPNLIYVRPIQISQVLLNLLNNAIDAIESSPGHKLDKKIEVEVEVLPDVVAIRVFDSGPGIPPEIREKIMQPFYTTKEVGQGTGLGLSISLGIARAHGGDLFFNKNFKRTCFELQLPLRSQSTSDDPSHQKV